MGVVLVDRVIGVEQGGVCLFRNMAGRRKSAEFTVGMDDVRPPGQEFLQQLFLQGNPQPRFGIDGSRSHRAQIIHAVLHIGGCGVGKGQDADLMAPVFQSFAQIQHGSHHTVYRRREPVCGQS